MKYLNVGNQVLLNPRMIEGVCPVASLDEDRLQGAIDFSGGTRRSAVIMNDHQIFLVDARFSTLKERLEQDTK